MFRFQPEVKTSSSILGLSGKTGQFLQLYMGDKKACFGSTHRFSFRSAWLLLHVVRVVLDLMKLAWEDSLKLERKAKVWRLNIDNIIQVYCIWLSQHVDDWVLLMVQL